MRLLCIALFLTGASVLAQSVQVWETDGDQSKLLTQRPGLTLAAGTGSGALTITVNDQLTYQQMDGFGASLTDSSAAVFSTAFPDAASRTAVMKSLFDPVTGIGLSFLRQPMGASDFSASGNYSYDDMPAGQTDPQLQNFSITHDLAQIVPLLEQALAINPSAKVMMLPWSPPAWMKSTQSMNGGEMNETYFPTLAQYFVKSIEAYQSLGIPVYAIAAQNEPLNDAGYPSMYLAATDEAAFIGGYLGPALSAASLGNVQILGYEHNWDQPGYPETILADPTALSYVAGSSFHCYGGDVSAQSTVEAAYPSKGIWFTECSGTVGSSFAGDLQWNAENLLIGATRSWARSVVLWNLALDQNNGPRNGGCTNCRGVITIDTSTAPPNITRNVEYYVLGHLAKFVQPGARRVDSNTFSGGIEDVAFKNPDGSLVLLVLNATSGPGTPGTFSVNWSGQTFSDTLPPGALATYVWSSLQPQFPSNGVVNWAAVAQPLSPGGIFSIYGTQMAGAVYGAKHFPLTTSVGSTSVSVGGVPAPLFFISPDQINAQMPWEVTPGAQVPVTLTTGGQSATQNVTVALGGPAIAIALNPDYSANSQNHPAPSGGYVVLYGTGPGLVTPAAATGAVSPASPLEYAAKPWSAGPLQVYFAGMAPGYVGLLQVNVAVPIVTEATSVPIALTINGQTANPVSVWVAP